MKIAINTRLLLPNKLEGIGWFTYEVTKRLVENHPQHHFYLLFDRKFDEKFVFGSNCTPLVLYPQARHPFLYKIWFDYAIPRVLEKHNIDLFLSPDGFLSKRTEVPQISVIHDLNFEHIPEDLPSKHTRYYKNNFPEFSKIAGHIVTVSEYSKQDISKTYSIEDSKITVAYNGASDVFVPVDEKQRSEIRTEYANGAEYFVYVGALHKRKNISRMLQAFDAFKSETSSDIKFVIVGEKLFKSNDIDETCDKMTFKQDVVFTGRLSQVKLAQIVGSAKAMVYVSYFEGFGIPVLESLKCGVPVLTSNVTSLPEVGGNACVYCDPVDIKSIEDGMKKLINTNFDINELLAQSNKFSWDKTAEVIAYVLNL